MALTQITYINKETLNEQPSVADKNKVKADDMNEIKSVVNTNAGKVGDLSNLTTTAKTSIVESVNELKGGEVYSTTEEILTNKSLNGKPIYRAYLEYSVNSSDTATTFNHNLSIDVVTGITALCSLAGQSISEQGYRPMPQTGDNLNYRFYINNIKENTISFVAKGWNNNKAYITLEYTKTTD